MSYILSMRIIVLTIAYATALLVAPHSAIAGSSAASACYNVQDADARAYCLARVHRDPGRCYNVQRADLRSACQAEAHQPQRDREAEKRNCPFVPRSVHFACIAKANR